MPTVGMLAIERSSDLRELYEDDRKISSKLIVMGDGILFATKIALLTRYV